eukprot:11226150-Lingulodinium_polyedra.AAC.1
MARVLRRGNGGKGWLRAVADRRPKTWQTRGGTGGPKPPRSQLRSSCATFPAQLFCLPLGAVAAGCLRLLGR